MGRKEIKDKNRDTKTQRRKSTEQDRGKEMEKVVKIVKKSRQKTDFEFWNNQPYEKRLETIEQIRKEFHNGFIQRFQRVYRIIKRSQG